MSETVIALDQRVFLRRVPWSHYEIVLALRGEATVPRIAYLDGDLELMAPSKGHEQTRKTIARLVEAYADETRIDLWAFGSWTLKDARKDRGAEPDECYALERAGRSVPDLAIEVAWSRGGLDKLEIYRGLGVPEVWTWEKGAITAHLLAADGYRPSPRSQVFPDLDLALVARLASHENPSEAVRELRAAVRAGPSR